MYIPVIEFLVKMYKKKIKKEKIFLYVTKMFCPYWCKYEINSSLSVMFNVKNNYFDERQRCMQSCNILDTIWQKYAAV